MRNAIALVAPVYPVTFRKLFAQVGLGNLGPADLIPLLVKLKYQGAAVPVSIDPGMTGPLLDQVVIKMIDDNPTRGDVTEEIAALMIPLLGTGSTALTGIDEYREPWELEAPPESQ